MAGLSLRSARTQRRRAARRAAAHDGPHTCEKLGALERLYEVVVRAEVEALNAVLKLSPCGEDQDRHVVGLAEAAQHLNAVDLRESEVQDHQIGQEFRGLFQSLLAIAGGAHLVPFGPKRAPQHIGDLCVVLDDQHAACLSL